MAMKNPQMGRDHQGSCSGTAQPETAGPAAERQRAFGPEWAY